MEELKASDLDALEKIARAATPGPWETRFRFGRKTTVSGRQRFPICDTATAPRGEANERREEASAAHIAAFDPPTILALIALARRSLPSPEAGVRQEVMRVLKERAQVGIVAYHKVYAIKNVEDLADAILAVIPSPEAGGADFQARVRPWIVSCFGEDIAADKLERNDRFIEEALELTQSTGYTAERAHALVDYVFGRPVGDPPQEAGGVMVTLAAHCLAHGLDMHEAGETELNRIQRPEIIEKIRAKQKAKPTGSALPVALPAAPEAGGVIAEARACTAITWPVLQRHIDKLADLAERQASEIERKDAEIAELTAEATRWSEAYGRLNRSADVSDLSTKDAENARLRAVLAKSAEGWANAIELGLIPPQHVTCATILRDEAQAALNPTKGAGL